VIVEKLSSGLKMKQVEESCKQIDSSNSCHFKLFSNFEEIVTCIQNRVRKIVFSQKAFA
jgi:hypothetical protein